MKQLERTDTYMFRVLVVDDDPPIAELLGFILRQAGYQVTTANMASAALAQLEQESFDLLMLDIMLPDMDGLELCRQIRQTDQVPIIFLSGFAVVTDKELALRVGGNDYIVKPFGLNELLARTEAVLQLTGRLTSSESQLRHADLTLDDIKQSVALAPAPGP